MISQTKDLCNNGMKPCLNLWVFYLYILSLKMRTSYEQATSSRPYLAVSRPGMGSGTAQLER